MELHSRRLRLVAATLDLAKAELEDRARFAVLLGAGVPSDWPPETLRDVIPQFAKWLEDHADWTGWLGWYAVRLDTPAPVLCGSVGFRGPPDASGMVEIGYSVLSDHQRQGLATDMVETLVQWAFAQSGVQSIEAETTDENLASIRVLECNHFQRVTREGQGGSRRYRSTCGRGRPTTR